MDWNPGGISSDLEDRRNDSSGGGGFGGGGIGILGFVLLVTISLVLGHNFLGGMSSGGDSQPARAYSSAAPAQTQPAGEDRDVQLISFVLDDAQKTWTGIFQQMGKPYRHAKLVLFRGSAHRNRRRRGSRSR